jgi:lipopolysaccharide assembly outer membrane protein LptD (OstA)
MKRALALACLLGSRALAQDVTLVYYDDPSLVPRINLTTRIGTQTISIPLKSRMYPAVTAKSVARDGHIITASGEVQLRMPTFALSADRAVVNGETREISASGNVRITLISPTRQ